MQKDASGAVLYSLSVETFLHRRDTQIEPKVTRCTNQIYSSWSREINTGSFNELLKRLNTAKIIELRVNRRAINPLEYYRIYKEYPETILSAIFEVDEELKMIQKYQSNLW